MIRKLIINKHVNTNKMSTKLEQNIHLPDDRICSYYIRKQEESGIILNKSTKKTASSYQRARRIQHQNMSAHEKSGIKICLSTMSTKKMASFYIKARRKRHHFIHEHEEININLC